MPLVEFMGDRIRFPESMGSNDIQDVLGAMAASTKAVGEFAAMLGTSSIAEPLSGLAGIATANPSNVRKVQEALTYQPKTRAGMVAMQAIGRNLSKLSEATGAEHLSGYWRDRVVPALQEQAGPITGSILAAGGLGLIAAMSEVIPGSKGTRRLARGQEGALKAFHGSPNEIRGDFDSGTYFSQNPDYANQYSTNYDPSMRDTDKSAVYPVTLDEAEFLDTRQGKGKELFDEWKAFMPDGSYSNHSSGLPDHNDESRFMSWAFDNGKLDELPKGTFVDENNGEVGIRVFDQGSIKSYWDKPKEKITAFHGSPHEFDKFSMDAIGTGEGAQAYGHGLYFAESEDVAKGYRDTLSPLSVDIPKYVTESGLDISNEIQGTISQQIYHGKGSAERRARYVGYGNAAARDIPQEKLSEIIDKGMKAQEGSMYQVDIDATPDEFLDWDLPLSEQSEGVRGALKEKGYTTTPEEMNAYDDSLLDALFNDGSSPAQQPRNPTGEAMYRDLGHSRLKEQGFKGIRYKDGFSRGDTGGTSNYVVFDENIISIAKKYGIAIPAAAAMLGVKDGYIEDDSL